MDSLSKLNGFLIEGLAFSKILKKLNIPMETLKNTIYSYNLEEFVVPPSKNNSPSLEESEETATFRAECYIRKNYKEVSFKDWNLEFRDDNFNNFEIGNIVFRNKKDIGKVINIFAFVNLFKGSSGKAHEFEEKEEFLEEPIEESIYAKNCERAPQIVDDDVFREFLSSGKSFSGFSEKNNISLEWIRKRINKNSWWGLVIPPDINKPETLENSEESARIRARAIIRDVFKKETLLHGYTIGFKDGCFNNFDFKNIIFIPNGFKGLKNKLKACKDVYEFKELLDFKESRKGKIKGEEDVERAELLKAFLSSSISFSKILERLNWSKKTLKNYLTNEDMALERYVCPPNQREEETMENDIELANLRARMYLKRLFKEDGKNEVDFSRQRVVFFDNNINNFKLNNLILVNVKANSLKDSHVAGAVLRSKKVYVF